MSVCRCKQKCGCGDKKIDRLRKRAIAYARKKRIDLEDAEDFSQDFIVYHLETGKTRLEWYFIDWLREIYGREDLGYKTQIRARRGQVVQVGDEIDRFISTDRSPEKVVMDRELVDMVIDYARGLPERKADMFALAVTADTKADAAKECGVDISRISQVYWGVVRASLKSVVGYGKSNQRAAKPRVGRSEP